MNQNDILKESVEYVLFSRCSFGRAGTFCLTKDKIRFMKMSFICKCLYDIASGTKTILLIICEKNTKQSVLMTICNPVLYT